MVGAIWLWASRVSTAEPVVGANGLPPAPAVGHPAPDIKLTTVTGETFVLAALRGKPVVLNFWATWCPPCVAELPEFQAASQRYAGQVDIVGVNQVEPAAGVAAFAQRSGLTFPIPLDTTSDVSRRYAVRSLPTTFFIDSRRHHPPHSKRPADRGDDGASVANYLSVTWFQVESRRLKAVLHRS